MRSVNDTDVVKLSFVAATRTCTASPPDAPLGAVQLGGPSQGITTNRLDA